MKLAQHDLLVEADPRGTAEKTEPVRGGQRGSSRLRGIGACASATGRHGAMLALVAVAALVVALLVWACVVLGVRGAGLAQATWAYATEQ